MCRFIRRWFRGRTTCARCDIEFRPYPHSALAEKRDRTVPKTPVKHSSAGQAAVPKDVRKPEPRLEEKVLNNCFISFVCRVVHISDSSIKPPSPYCYWEIILRP